MRLISQIITKIFFYGTQDQRKNLFINLIKVFFQEKMDLNF